MRILIIEDDEKLCEAMRFALEMEGYIADVCHDGDDGFRWARSCWTECCRPRMA